MYDAKFMSTEVSELHPRAGRRSVWHATEQKLQISMSCGVKAPGIKPRTRNGWSVLQA